MSGDDIVERLRGWVPSDFWNRAVGEMRDAADAIEARDAEIERLRAEIKRLRAAGDALAKRLWRGGGDLADMIAAVAAWEEASRG